MRYLCTIYAPVSSLANTTSFAGSEANFDIPSASISVRGTSLRDAAARAYVRVVGRARAKQLRQQGTVHEEVIAQETNPAAIAASLRKVVGRQGIHYQMDNLVDVWAIRVEPDTTPTQLPRRYRPQARHLYHFSRYPSPN